MVKISAEIKDEAFEKLKELCASVDLDFDTLISGILNSYALGGAGHPGGTVDWGFSSTGKERLIIVEWPRVFLLFRAPLKEQVDMGRRR